MEDKKKYIIIGGVAILVIVIASVVGIFLYKTSSNNKVKSTLKEEINYIMKNISDLNKSTYKYLLISSNKDKNSNNAKKPVDTNVDFYFDLDITKSLNKSQNRKIFTIENALNNSEISFTTSRDTENRYHEASFKYKNENERLNTNFYFNNNNMYVYAKDFLDKHVSVINENSTKLEKYALHLVNSELSLTDINSLLSVVKDTVDDVKINDKLSSTKENVNINNTVKEVVKDKLLVDNELAVRFTSKLIENIVDNPKALSIINKVEGSENISDTKTILLKEYSLLNNGQKRIFKENENICINTYTEGFFPSFIMQQIEHNVDENLNESFAFLKYNINGYKEHFSFGKGNYNVVLDVQKLELSKHKLNITVKENELDKYFAEISGVISPKKVDITYNLKSQDLNILNGKVEYSQSLESKTKNSKLRIEFNAENIDYGKGKVEISTATRIRNTLRKHEIKNETKYEDLSEGDKNQIKITTLKKLPNIYTLIKWK